MLYIAKFNKYLSLNIKYLKKNSIKKCILNLSYYKNQITFFKLFTIFARF